MKKDRKTFNFKNVVIDYCPQGMLYAYYLSDDNTKNKEVNYIICDMGYKRDRLVKSYPLVELSLGFEYKRLGIYISNEHYEELKQEKERRAFIRKVPNV